MDSSLRHEPRSDAGYLLTAIDTGVRAAVGSGRPEAVLREHVQPALSTLLASRGTRSASHDEVSLHVPDVSQASVVDAPLNTQGRADAIYNRFVIEFEPPGSLSKSVQHSATRHAVSQVQQYLRGIADQSGLPIERLAGCAFDGYLIVYVTWERGAWQIANPTPADPPALNALIDTLESLSRGRGLTADNLNEDFGRGSSTAARVIRAFTRVLVLSNASSRALALFDEWQLDLGNASGPFSLSDKNDWNRLCAEFGIDDLVTPPEFILFAMQTYFALVTKLVSVVVLEGCTDHSLLPNLTSRSHTRAALNDLEQGIITARVGAINVIEPGLFSWYVHEGDEDLDAALGQMIDLVTEYSAEIVEISPATARDILKDLYQRLLPRSIRHRLGEYYTPDWLAERVVNQVTGSLNRLTYDARVLDPACGSGTFLVEVISRMVSNRGNTDPTLVLSKILENVVGFDLSPLAVQAARVNYLLALAPLLTYIGPDKTVSIPVYLADSLSPPRPGDLLDGHVRVFNSSEGEWRVPGPLADASYLDDLGRVFQSALADNHDREWVAREVQARIPIDRQLDPSIFDVIDQLYEKLHDLHIAGRNGIWWQLIRNAFAPALEPRFDYVIGNPPWVRWQTLPEAYRQENDYHWLGYSLRPEAPPGRRQPSANVQLDVSMLFTAYSIDQYLKSDGRLGFVITSTVFKSELAGRGFRLRQLSNGRRYQFMHIDDMSRLQVFSNATNQTAVLIARPGRPRSDRVPVTRWSGIDTRTIPTGVDLDVVKTMTRRRNFYGEPADPRDSASPLLVMPRAGLGASLPVRRPSHYRDVVRKGIDTRGANGVFFLEVASDIDEMVRVRNVPSAGRNRAITMEEAVIERAATRRLLRGTNVGKGYAQPAYRVLFFHDDEHRSRPLQPDLARDRFPAAFAFAERFRGVLSRRKKFRGFNPTGDEWLGLYSVTKAALEKHKVVVREISSGMIAAAIHGSEIIPDHKLYVIPCKSALEADRLAVVLNSSVVDYLLQSFSISTSITGSFLRYIGIIDLSVLPHHLEGDALVASALELSTAQYNRLAAVAEAELKDAEYG